MALKKLAADLENFKYGLSSPDRIDSQIENGVDFFNDEEGGATGFTPKAGDLESQYKKFMEGTVGTKWPEAARTNEINFPRSAFGQNGEYAEEGNPGLASTPWMRPYYGDTQLGPGVLSGFQPNYYANLLPVEAATMWMTNSGAYRFIRGGTNPPNNDLMQDDFKSYPAFNVNDQITLKNIKNPEVDGGTFTITNQPGQSAWNDPLLPDADGSDFMTTPLANYVSQYPNQTPSVTWGDEDGTMLGPVDPIEPEQFLSNFMTVPLEDRLTRYPDPAGNMPDMSKTYELGGAATGVHNSWRRSDAFTLQNTVKWPEAAKSYDKERGGYDQYLHRQHSGFVPDPILSNTPINIGGLYNESQIPGNSVHISNLGQIKAGFGYGASSDGGFKIYDQGTDALTDIFSDSGYITTPNLYPIPVIDNSSTASQIKIVPISEKIGFVDALTATQLSDLYEQRQAIMDSFGSNNVGILDNAAAVDEALQNINSEISQLEGIDTSAPTTSNGITLMHNILPIQSNAIAKSNFNEGYNSSNYLSELNLGEFLWGQGFKEENALTLVERAGGGQKMLFGQKLYKRKSLFDSTSVPVMKKGVDNDQAIYGGNNKEVPAGLNELNKFGTKSFREVADPGKNNHPLIIRDMGNNWGMDSLGDNPLSEAIGGFVRGAPGITGLMSRSINDKIRIGKWMLLTSDGLAFALKQFGLQALNPAIETKIWNPLSTLSLVGGQEAFDAVTGLVESIRGDGFRNADYRSALSGMAQLAASALLPIGQPERHIGGKRYEEVLLTTTSKGRLAFQSAAFSFEPDINLPMLDTGVSFIDDRVNSRVGQVVDEAGDAALYSTMFLLSNPNRYAFPISSAPKLIRNGVPSFIGQADVLLQDIANATNKEGGTFNKQTSIEFGGKSFSKLHKDNSYKAFFKTDSVLLDGLQIKTAKYFDEEYNPAGGNGIDIKNASGLILQIPKVFSTSTEAQSTDSLGNSPRAQAYREAGVTMPPVTSENIANGQLLDKVGGNFNPQTAYSPNDTTEHGINTTYGTLSYEKIPDKQTIDQENPNFYDVGGNTLLTDKGAGGAYWADEEKEDFQKAKKIVRHLGETYGGRKTNPAEFLYAEGEPEKYSKLNNKIKSTDLTSAKGDNTDRINMIPLTSDKKMIEKDENKDFIKFMFKDLATNKYLVFRAIVDGITDTITPEYNDIKFIGRPDKLYTYQGTERAVTFNFKIYPTTKQELPILMEKLNYLVGLCYPSYTVNERMIAPFVELTLGDMFKDTPGLLDSLTVTVEDATTWEIEDGLQFPHFISCACSFKYIGTTDNTPVKHGKFYDLSWLKGNNRLNGRPIGTFRAEPFETANPDRSAYTYINDLASDGNAS